MSWFTTGLVVAMFLFAGMCAGVGSGSAGIGIAVLYFGWGIALVGNEIVTAIQKK